MKVSLYSTIWGLKERPTSFDITGALRNWAVYANQISIACGDDYSLEAVAEAARASGLQCEVTLTRTTFDFATDSFAYGKTENAALQACTGDLLIQQNMDERIRVDKTRLAQLHTILEGNPTLGSFFIPNIDLYGSTARYLPPFKSKWTIHRRGLYRGPVSFGLKADGRPDYNRTSTDELINERGELVPTARLLEDTSIESLRAYVASGLPIVYHLGYVSLVDRLDRSLWWKEFWNKATGDPNQHPTSVAEMAARSTIEHGLPLWPVLES